MKTMDRNKTAVRITVAGMAAMTVLTVLKAVFDSQLAASALIISGIALFFVVEAVMKTPDAESGLSFRRFFPDLKKPGVIPLIGFMAALTVAQMYLDKLLFGKELVEHVLGRAKIMASENVASVLLNQVFVVVGEEIGFRGFFVGKGMKVVSFWPAALLSAAVFAAAHFAAGSAAVVACDLGAILIDGVLYALLYRKTGNCLISCIPHFAGNMLGYFLVPVIFG